MKNKLLNYSREKKVICFVIGLFMLNLLGMIPVGIIGAYTTESMKITSETLENGL